MPKYMLISLIKFIHNMGSTIWIGALILIATIVIPEINKVKDKEIKQKLMAEIYKKLTILIAVVIPILFLSGLPLAKKNPLFHGLFNFSNTYSTLLSIKVLLAILMVIIVVLRKMTQRKFMLTKDMKYLKISDIYVYINLAIGTIVTLLSSICASIPIKGA